MSAAFAKGDGVAATVNPKQAIWILFARLKRETRK